MSKKHILIIIYALILVILLLPIVLEFFVFRNEVYSALTNGEWGGFLGSYIGGAIGGIGTLLAVYITTKETQKVQNDTLNQMQYDRDLSAKKERKEFADEIASNVAKYIAEISAYAYGCRALERLNTDLITSKRQLQDIEVEIQHFYEMERQNDDISHLEVEINLLRQKEAEQKYKIENIEKDIEINKVNRVIANECYFLLKIKLRDIEEAKYLIEQLNYIHENSANIENTSINWLEEAIERLQKNTISFIYRYVEQKLI